MSDVALVVCCSVKGSPGVTTATLALAAAAQRRAGVLVADCDPAGGDVAARVGCVAEPGLVSLAAAARAHVDAPPENGHAVDGLLVGAHARPYASGVQVLPGPVGGVQAAAAVGVLAGVRPHPLVAAARQPGRLLLADVGRLTPASAGWSLATTADVLLVVVRPRFDAVAHLDQPWLPALNGPAGNRRVWLLMIGRGSYNAEEITATTQLPVLGALPLDRAGAAVVPAAVLGNWSARRSRLVRSARGLLPELLAAAGVDLATGPPARSRRARRSRMLALADRETP